jgi:hypothetical protein
VKPVLIDPLSLGSPTVAELAGVGKGLAGAAFGAVMIAVAFLLPQRPFAGNRAPVHASNAAR